MHKDIKQKLSELLNFIHLAEKLKTTIRHGWASTGRRESVAEHSWRLSFLAILLSPYMGCKINLERAVGMAVIHDFCEVLTGDVPFFEALEGSPEKAKKHLLEQQAMDTLLNLLDKEAGEIMRSFWEEYQTGASEEAKFVHALDKLEAQIQQNEADTSTWNAFEKQSIFTYLDMFCDYNPFLKSFKEEVREESVAKLYNMQLTTMS